MKKIFFLLAGIILIAGFWWIARFYWNNLRGIEPVIRRPPQDIVKALNTTGIPLTLPLGFSISIFAKNLGTPRAMTYDPMGNLLVSITKEGKVLALQDKNEDGAADQIITVIEGLNNPHGLAFHCKKKCELFIAESDKVAIYDYDEKNVKALNQRKIIDLPDRDGHFTRTILFMPWPNNKQVFFSKTRNNKLLISVGSSCNVCNEADWRRAKILIANPDGSELKPFASGLRNAVFMTNHPMTSKIWATEMGRDLLGDDLPPDEINIVEEGKDYGWPECYGKNILDEDFHNPRGHIHKRAHCIEPFEAPSYIDIPAHSSPLGLAFIPQEEWPQEYWHNLLVAYHGSWNRSVPTGYKIVRYKLDAQGNYLGEEDFISGWLTQTQQALGRPVDILALPGGVIYISDDKAGVIYRLTYQGAKHP